MELGLRDFNIREANWQADGNVLSNIRKLVFIVEQQVPKEEEWDGQDEEAWHWLATDQQEQPVGTARLLADGQIGRMAVLDAYRNRGVGRALLEQAVLKARHLGFDSVFLNAQSHALAFYEAAGFIAEGDEFMEAGIPHYRMTRSLEEPDDEVTRVTNVTSSLQVALREFDTAEVTWAEHGNIIRKLRETVLIRELGLDSSLAEDETDQTAIHWHAQNHSGQTIGALRMTVKGTISHLVVDQQYRGVGVGHALIEQAIAKARRFDLTQLTMNAIESAGPFFIRLGFEPVIRTESATPAVSPAVTPGMETFRLQLEALEPAITRPVGDDYDNGERAYVLGKDKQVLFLRREDEFRNVITEMCRQATMYIRILSPMLDHNLFNNQELQQICSSLARRNRYTRIEILIYDSHRIVKNGHLLLELSRRLPSSIGIKIVHPDLRQLNHEYVLADDRGVIYRNDHENYEGYANFNDITGANRLTRQFQRAWNSGLYDANLRQLRI